MDCLCLKAGIRGIAPSISVNGSSLEVRTNPSHVSAVVGRCSSSSSAALSTVETSLPQQKTASSSALPRFSLRYPLRSLWPGGGRYGMALDDAVLVEGKEEAGKGVDAKEEEGEGRGMVGSSTEDKNGNWVLKILNARPLWNGGDAVEEEKDAEAEEEEKCDACKILDDEEEEEENIEFNRESFSKLLRRVTLTDARLYAQMSHLGNLAYCIPKIKRGNLLRYYGLRFITSSIEKKELVSASEFEEPKKEEIVKKRNNIGYQISASAVYDIAASSASYLFSQSKIMLPFKSSKAKSDSDDSLPKSSRVKDRNIDMTNSEMTSLMATTDSVTAVIAAKEEVKQAVADNLNSVKSSPCEWFICDDDQSSTRFFAIQGSESLASWQANLLFEPIQFERLDVIVHRGIYEAAKGIYEQMLPEIRAHLESHGPRSMFRFTGHSLGGSLALLVNLMLLIRGQVPASSLLPVVTFGAPSIMCGGDLLLQKLGLPQTHVQSVMMHRDIVTRAFSCKYPDHIAKLLKAINGNFRNHPCLNNQKLLYAPMGELLILQPDEKFSPHHELLPSGSGLYLLTCPLSDSNDVEKQLRVARMVFLNTPHPLEMLSDRSAYGSDGTIQRDHDVNSYLKSVRGVIRQELNRIRKAKREHQRKVWWLLVGPCGVINPGIILERGLVSINLAGQHRFDFSRVVHSGRETVKRLSQLVAFQHMHLFVVLLLPARLILLKACGMITSSH